MAIGAAADVFVDELKNQVAERHANLNHPFARRLIEGKLSRDQLRGWAGQRYKGITGMGMDVLGQLFVKAPDERVRGHVWELLGEEGGFAATSGASPRGANQEPGPSVPATRMAAAPSRATRMAAAPSGSHSEWLFQFGAALGMTPEDFRAVEPLPETLAIHSFYLNKFYQASFLEAFASMVAVESQNPQGFAAWAKALEEHYGLGRPSLAFFLGHVEADSEEGGHAGAGWEIMRQCANTDELRDSVRRAVRQSLEMYWLSLDGIYRAYVGAL